MNHGLVVEYLYHDADVLEVRVSASNGHFAGSTAVYIARNELHESAKGLDGFPISRTDVRELVWGAFGAEYAGGAVRLTFNCIDAAQHAQLSVELEDADAKQSVLVIAAVEPAGIDKFVPQLRVVAEELGGRATLDFS